MVVNDPGRSPAVRRAVAALDLVAHTEQANAAEISQYMKLAKSSTSDLVTTMNQQGFLRHTGDDYVLGDIFTELTTGYTGDPGLLSRFATQWDQHPLLHDHTVAVQSVLGTRALCLDARLGRYVLPTTPRAGRIVSLLHDGEGSPLLQLLAREALADTLHRFENYSHTARETAETLEWWDASGGLRPFAVQETGRGDLSVGVSVPPQVHGYPPLVLTAHLLSGHAYRMDELREALSEFAIAVAAPPWETNRPASAPDIL